MTIIFQRLARNYRKEKRMMRVIIAILAAIPSISSGEGLWTLTEHPVNGRCLVHVDTPRDTQASWNGDCDGVAEGTCTLAFRSLGFEAAMTGEFVAGTPVGALVVEVTSREGDAVCAATVDAGAVRLGVCRSIQHGVHNFAKATK